MWLKQPPSTAHIVVLKSLNVSTAFGERNLPEFGQFRVFCIEQILLHLHQFFCLKLQIEIATECGLETGYYGVMF